MAWAPRSLGYNHGGGTIPLHFWLCDSVGPHTIILAFTALEDNAHPLERQLNGLPPAPGYRD